MFSFMEIDIDAMVPGDLILIKSDHSQYIGWYNQTDKYYVEICCVKGKDDRWGTYQVDKADKKFFLIDREDAKSDDF